MDENGIKSNEEKVEAILKLKPPSNTKKMKSFLGAIQYLAKFLPNLPEKTEKPKKMLNKNDFRKWKKNKRKISIK